MMTQLQLDNLKWWYATFSFPPGQGALNILMGWPQVNAIRLLGAPYHDTKGPPEAHQDNDRTITVNVPSHIITSIRNV